MKLVFFGFLVGIDAIVQGLRGLATCEFQVGGNKREREKEENKNAVMLGFIRRRGLAFQSVW